MAAEVGVKSQVCGLLWLSWTVAMQPWWGSTPLLGTWRPCPLPLVEACFTLANPDHSYSRRLAWDSSHPFACYLKREDISQFKEEKDWLHNLTPERLIKYFVEKALKGNTCRKSKKRKYAFASLWNCSNRFIGKKLKALYFEVLMLLFCE